MKYNYEFLRKCHGLRFRATIDDKQEEGIIKVAPNTIELCYGEPNPGDLMTFERWCVLNVCEDAFSYLPEDFEIVPRAPETYKDWQVGDKIIMDEKVMIVIFRCGEFVLFKYSNDECSIDPYTCKELYDKGYRLVLTDVEKEILEEKNWKPKDGDICFVETNARTQKFIIIYNYNSYFLADLYGAGWALEEAASWAYTHIRPATDEEKQLLFDALAKEGKRWNAEKKCVEDTPKPYEFKKGDPVLVRDYGGFWEIKVFTKMQDSYCKYMATTDGVDDCGYRECIPYNDKTMHLLGTTEDYEQ